MLSSFLSRSARAVEKLPMDSTVPTRIRWILVVCITIMASIFFVDRVNISIAGHSIAQDYHLTDVQLGKIFSAFYIGYGVFQIPSGWLADRLGPRRMLAWAPSGGRPSPLSRPAFPPASRKPS